VVESGPGNGVIGDWRIGGRIVRVSASTLVDTEWGAFTAGSFVEAKGVFGADGVLAATKIEVKTGATAPGAGGGSSTTAPVPVELKGKIQAVPGGTLIGDWLVSGWTVRVTSSTSVNLEHGQAMAGAFVEAKGFRTGAMSIQATSIEVKPSTTIMAVVTPMTSMTGVLEDRPSGGMLGEWRIDGRRVHVQSETEIELEDETISHRSRLRVTGVERADGVVVASSLRTAPPSTDDSRPLFRISGRVDDNPKPEGIEVEGRKVVIGPATIVKQEFGSLGSAAFVEVKGRMRDDGTIEAEKVEVLPPPPGGATPAMFREIKGVIERIPAGGGSGLWVVAGKTVRVTAATRIERLFGQAAPGAAVKVEGWSLADGTLEAVEIQALPSRP
jgi:hypothetical protein